MPNSISPLLHPRTKSGCKWMSTKAVPISFSGSRCSRVSSMHLVASSAAKIHMASLKWRVGNCPCSPEVGMGSRIEVLFQKFRPLASSCRTMISVTSRRYTWPPACGHQTTFEAAFRLRVIQTRSLVPELCLHNRRAYGSPLSAPRSPAVTNGFDSPVGALGGGKMQFDFVSSREDVSQDLRDAHTYDRQVYAAALPRVDDKQGDPGISL